MVFGICSCYLHRNLFLRKLNLHINYTSEEQLIKELGSVVRNDDEELSLEALLQDVNKEMEQRKEELRLTKLRKNAISENYEYKCQRELESFSPDWLTLEFQMLFHNLPLASDPVSFMAPYTVEGLQGVFQFPFFTEAFIHLLNTEIDNFRQSGLDHSRPNTMNRYGILFNELELIDKNIMSVLREHWLQPIAQCLFPEWVGSSGLDSHRAFTVEYAIGEDENLFQHYDNAEVTINVCLRADCEGGELLFYNMHPNARDTTAQGVYNDGRPSTSPTIVQHLPGYGVLHRSQHVHAASPVRSGNRRNLIIWMRSSAVRSTRCPRCNEPPHALLPVEDGGFGDGFEVSR